MRIVAESGHARLAAPPADERPADVTLVMGTGPPPLGAPAIRWFDGRPEPPDTAVARRIAPEGSDLWRRAPWPAADALFEVARPGPHADVLVAGGSASRRDELVAAIGGRGAPVRAEEQLTAEALEEAATVVLLPSDTVAGEALPLESAAVLAARRLLIAPRATITFGLAPGVDYLDFALSTEAANVVDSIRREPAAFAAVRSWGSVAAKRHRASDVYRALALDLELEGFARKS